MSYIYSIKTAIFVFPFIALLFTIPFILRQYHKYGSINPFRVLIVYSFILYMLCIYFLVILPLPKREEVIYKPDMIKLIPFGFIGDIIKESSLVLNDPKTYLTALKEPCFYTVIFNIFMTIPFGMYLRYYFKSSFKKTTFLSFLLSLFFETTQITGLYFIYPYPYRVFDVDDLIMNTLGGMIGYFLMGGIDNFLPTREEIDRSSLKKGEVVSGLRRIVVFCLDIFIWNLLYIFISIFIKSKYLMPSIFFLYYIVYPYFKNGKTIGSKFLNVRLEFSKYRFIRLTLRILFLYLYYFGSIYLVFTIHLGVIRVLNLDKYTMIGLTLILLLFLFLFYLVSSIVLLKNRKIFYDNFFKVKYVSTIRNPEDITTDAKNN